MLKNLVQTLLRRADKAHPASAGGESAAELDRLRLCITGAAERAAAGEHAAAAELYRESLKLRPQDPRLWCNLGAELDAIGQTDEVERAYRRAVELDAGMADAWYNLARLLQLKIRTAEAESCYRAAAALVDGDGNRQLWLLIHRNWGLLLYNQGRLQEALALYREALAEYPHAPDLFSNLLHTMQYVDTTTQAESFAAHVSYAQRFEAPLKPDWRPHANSRESGKRLKIGYFSPDFRDHAVAFFIEPVLAHHDHEQCEVYCYCGHSVPDAVTLRLKALVGHWRDVDGASDDESAERIRADGIDILVDLAGHTAGGRLQIFARKPAPVQVSWLGYPCTTGLAALDYRISDAHADRIGTSEQYYSEALYRLPDTFDCYSPPRHAPDVGGIPVRAQGRITFGSFNTLAKLAPGVRALWARLLLAVPGSRLMLKTVSLADAVARQRLIDDFAAYGVGGERLVLASADAAYSGHLSRYAEVDIGLDPFPYNGVTTSFEAMWMGVPVVTLAGNSFVSRMGVTALSNLGLAELIANTPEEYLAIAGRLAGDLDRLAALRAGLRDRMAKSPLMNAGRFTRNLEAAYRQMWTHWCSART